MPPLRQLGGERPMTRVASELNLRRPDPQIANGRRGRCAAGKLLLQSSTMSPALPTTTPHPPQKFRTPQEACPCGAGDFLTKSRPTPPRRAGRVLTPYLSFAIVWRHIVRLAWQTWTDGSRSRRRRATRHGQDRTLRPCARRADTGEQGREEVDIRKGGPDRWFGQIGRWRRFF